MRRDVVWKESAEGQTQASRFQGFTRDSRRESQLDQLPRMPGTGRYVKPCSRSAGYLIALLSDA